MSFEFRCSAKGEMAQAAVAHLLGGGGYRVRRVGVENILGSFLGFGSDEYHRFALREPLRRIPDLLVIDPHLLRTELVEVKFRRSFTESVARQLHGLLTDQRRYWPDSTAVLVVGDPVEGGRGFHQDHIRVVPAGETSLLVQPGLSPLERWRRLPHLAQAFDRFHGSTWHREIADSVTPSLRVLAAV